MSQTLHVVCPFCHVANRIPSARMNQQPVCGKCHQSLFNAQPVELTAASFYKHIQRSDIPVVVDFWASWCGPCKMMAPAFQQAARQLEPQVRFVKINTETETSLASQFAIRSIPTLIVFKGGQEVARQPGALAAADIVRWIQGCL